jgi:hypothetical protein
LPDISMCLGKSADGKQNCPKREKCYRYTAVPTPEWQAYFTEMPYKDKKCEYFWSNKGRS